jgi:CRISPR-associated protein Cst1
MRHEDEEEDFMLKYTGHPLVDVGAATIAAFAEKTDPAQLTEVDLDRVAEYMTRQYIVNPLKSFLTVAFPNSGFTQPAFEKQPERRLAYAHQVLRAYRPDTAVLSDRLCAFSGEPAHVMAYRQHIPLLTGEDTINFFAEGDSGLPVSGKVMLCLQALPLGCAKSAGRLLAVHSDNAELTFHFAQSFLEDNRRAIQLAQQEGSSKLAEPRLSMRTLLIETLLRAKRMQEDAKEDGRPFSITAYHLSNSGQDPSLSIYYLPLSLIGFLRDALTVNYQKDWQAMVQRAWEVPPQKKKGKPSDAPDVANKPFEPRRNFLYEDLFKLPDNARQFLRTYFLRVALKWAKQDSSDPRQTYSTKDEMGLVSWKMTSLFLRRIMGMDKTRVEQIKVMADGLAAYVSGQNDRRFFRNFFTEQRYDIFRNELLKVNLAHVKRGNVPIVTLDPYIEVFEEGDEVARPDWRLARDLVLIRMIEQLHATGWLAKNSDAIPDPQPENEAQ